jgi:hypothetical protein
MITHPPLRRTQNKVVISTARRNPIISNFIYSIKMGSTACNE